MHCYTAVAAAAAVVVVGTEGCPYYRTDEAAVAEDTHCY